MAKAKAPVVLFLGAGASAPIGFPTTAQFVKNIGLDPYDKKLIERYMNAARAELLKKAYERIQIKDIEGVYSFLSHHEKSPEIEFMMEQIEVQPDCARALRNHLNNISGLKRSIERIVHTSYDYQPEKHDKMAVEIYRPLFKFLLSDMMGNLSELPIVTTNYDPVIDNLLRMPFISDHCDVTDGFRLDERTDQYIYDDLEFARSGEKGKTIIKYYKLHGSVNWAIRKNDDALTKFSGISTFPHPGYESPVIMYPGDHDIQKRKIFQILNTHFESALINASVCIVIGFSFRDYSGINLSFEQIMRNDNKELYVEISNRAANLQDLFSTANLFNTFPNRYDYHSGGIQKLEKQLRKKYLNISRRNEEMKRA